MQYEDQSNSVTLAAPAKLNLFLKVLGRRSDGYHELETLMVSVGLYDTLRISPDPEGRLWLSCHDSGRIQTGAPKRELPPADSDNLVLRAANLLRQTTGTIQGARLELFKRIPMAAGLAGGSSDAAATLVGLNRLWKLHLAPRELHDLAAQLGSDIPFFLCPAAAAICRGRGEIVEPLTLPLRLHFVIARPQSGLSTAAVFNEFKPSSANCSSAPLVEACFQGQLDSMARCFHNSLQEPAERLCADVGTLKGWFARQGFVGHMMSGSGTSYFGLCQSRRHAQQLAARLKLHVSETYSWRKAGPRRRIDPQESGRGNHRSSHQVDGRHTGTLTGLLLDHVRPLLCDSRSEDHRRGQRLVRGHAQPQAHRPLPPLQHQKPFAGTVLQPVRCSTAAGTGGHRSRRSRQALCRHCASHQFPVSRADSDPRDGSLSRRTDPGQAARLRLGVRRLRRRQLRRPAGAGASGQPVRSAPEPMHRLESAHAAVSPGAPHVSPLPRVNGSPPNGVAVNGNGAIHRELEPVSAGFQRTGEGDEGFGAGIG